VVRVTAFCLFCLLLSSSPTAVEAVVGASGTTPTFATGQVWAYKTRPGEQMSRLLIDKVEDDPKLGHIYHITVTGLHIGRADGSTRLLPELPHLPVSEKTLTLSCTTLVGESEPNPDYLKGYQLWREAFEAGHAGIYTISVSEIVDIVEHALQGQQ
jgi:hypothetical protein